MKKLALTAAVLAALAGAMPASALAPVRMQVTAMEFEFRLSRPQLRAGRWSIIELVNLGQDEHDLKMRRVGGTKTYAIKTVLPGQRRYLAAKLRVGRYHLWCSIADHRARGMRAQLRVLPPPRPSR
jgi:uncharacterized cupredoxin-like copper-binding protein